MTTIVTPLGCSRSELNSQRAGGYEGESRSRAAEENRAEPLRHSLRGCDRSAARSFDLVYFHGKSVTEIAEIVGIAEAGVRWHGGRYWRPYRAGRSMAEPIERD
jgi:DNA-directed RNA polymerase specialized sigma24 family protein